jgi:hypothetical protein
MKQFSKIKNCNAQIHQHRQMCRKNVNLFVDFIILNLQWDIHKYIFIFFKIAKRLWFLIVGTISGTMFENIQNIIERTLNLFNYTFIFIFIRSLGYSQT